jgi:hypothetical protein
VAIWQDRSMTMVSPPDHTSVRRFVKKLRCAVASEARAIIETEPLLVLDFAASNVPCRPRWAGMTATAS